jgi:hypothetical protein
VTHREQQTFTITLHLSADFADDYGGDEDGYAWHERFQRAVRPRIVTALFDALRAQPGFRAVAAPRGRDPESALDLEVHFEPSTLTSR